MSNLNNVDDPKNGVQRIYMENKNPKEIISEMLDTATPRVLETFDNTTPAVFKRKWDELWRI